MSRTSAFRTTLTALAILCVMAGMSPLILCLSSFPSSFPHPSGASAGPQFCSIPPRSTYPLAVHSTLQPEQTSCHSCLRTPDSSSLCARYKCSLETVCGSLCPPAGACVWLPPLSSFPFRLCQHTFSLQASSPLRRSDTGPAAEVSTEPFLVPVAMAQVSLLSLLQVLSLPLARRVPSCPAL